MHMNIYAYIWKREYRYIFISVIVSIGKKENLDVGKRLYHEG